MKQTVIKIATAIIPTEFLITAVEVTPFLSFEGKTSFFDAYKQH